MPATSCDGSTNFWCKKSRACINKKFVCDLSDDCGDMSDEDDAACSGYTKYNFEDIDSAKYFIQGVVNDCTWIITSIIVNKITIINIIIINLVVCKYFYSSSIVLLVLLY